MNKNIFRNRTIIGAVCILLAVLVCFGITPLFNAGLKAQTEAVRVKAEVIPRGTYITADMVRSTPEARPVCLTPLPHHLTR